MEAPRGRRAHRRNLVVAQGDAKTTRRYVREVEEVARPLYRAETGAVLGRRCGPPKQRPQLGLQVVSGGGVVVSALFGSVGGGEAVVLEGTAGI